MKKTSNLAGLESREKNEDPLTDLLREGARRLIRQTIEVELDEFLTQFSKEKTPDGKSAVVRNGYLPERDILTGIGPVPVQVPKVRGKNGTSVTFRSSLVPPYVRKSRSLESALPWLYLKGISTGEMSDALSVLVGPDAKGLSANSIARLKQKWSDDYQSWKQKDLSKETWVYIWADGIYSRLRAESGKLCALVVIGVTESGKKHFLAIEDGMRESTQSWREVLLSLKSLGMNEPKLAIGDGAGGILVRP